MDKKALVEKVMQKISFVEDSTNYTTTEVLLADLPKKIKKFLTSKAFNNIDKIILSKSKSSKYYTLEIYFESFFCPPILIGSIFGNSVSSPLITAKNYGGIRCSILSDDKELDKLFKKQEAEGLGHS